MRSGRDERLWFTCYRPDITNAGFIYHFWKVQLPPLYTSQGFLTNLWATNAKNSTGPPMPTLPMDRNDALKIFKAMVEEASRPLSKFQFSGWYWSYCQGWLSILRMATSLHLRFDYERDHLKYKNNVYVCVVCVCFLLLFLTEVSMMFKLWL